MKPSNSFFTPFFAIIFAVATFISTMIPVAQAGTLTTTSRGGDSWTLTFSDDDITTGTSEAVFCNGRQAMIIKAELWMPSMGHGSSPVGLFPQAGGCTAIRNMNFMMRGDWEVRLWLNNNDSGKFSFDVR